MYAFFVASALACHPSQTIGEERVALSFYATDMNYFCASVANAVIQNNCAKKLDAVIHYSGEAIAPKSRQLPSEVKLRSGASLYIRKVHHQQNIGGFYKNSLDKFTAMHATGYNFTIFMDADQMILRDMWYVVNAHLPYELACVGFNLAELDHIGTLPTLIVTHNYPGIVSTPATTRLKNKPDGEVFDRLAKTKRFRKMILPAEAMCYSYDVSSGCDGSYLVHFSHGGKPWSATGHDVSPRMRGAWKAFGQSVKRCAKTGDIDVVQRELMEAMNSYADAHLLCTKEV